MAFCTRCGAPAQTEYCPQCGTRIAQAPPVAPQPPASRPINIPPPQQPAPTTPAVKKRSPLVWVALGCGGLLLVVAVIAVSTGLFVAYKAKQAGLDPALFEKNPGLAVAKILTSANPDLEVLSVDEDRGIIKVKDKKTGKTLSMSLEDVKNGRITFQNDSGETVEFEAKGEGESASINVRSPEGTLQIGAGAKAPDWLAPYPGAESLGAMQFDKEGQGAGGSYSFKTKDDTARVASFYEDALKKQGFEIERNVTPEAGLTTLSATDPNSGRTANVTITAQAGQDTVVAITFEAGN